MAPATIEPPIINAIIGIIQKLSMYNIDINFLLIFNKKKGYGPVQ